MTPDIQGIYSQFQTDEAIQDFMAYGKGHINDTFLIITEGIRKPNYILQRINHQIFENVAELMDNIRIVTDHIHKKQSAEKSTGQDVSCLKLVETRDQHTFVRDQEGNYWRCFHFIENAIIYENITKPEVALEAGKAIGNFQAMLADLDQQLFETLPRFHSFDRRYDEFLQAVNHNHQNRVEVAQEEVRFVEARLAEMESYFNSLKSENIPLRVTHNDTKVNNIIFNEEDKAVCLIDFDTVMPGYIHFDYGDALRTLANTAEEDEGDLSKADFDFKLFSSFTEGYLGKARSFLLPREIKMLPFAPRYLTFLIGLRFLNDYLNGDIYFKISEPNHNLRRTRVQFKLLVSMEEQYDKMSNFIVNLNINH